MTELEKILTGRVALLEKAPEALEQQLLTVAWKLGNALDQILAGVDRKDGKFVASQRSIQAGLDSYEAVLQALRDAGYEDTAQSFVDKYTGVVEGVKKTFELSGAKAEFSAVSLDAFETARTIDLELFKQIGQDAARTTQRAISQAVAHEMDYSTFVSNLKDKITGKDAKGAPLALRAGTFANTAIAEFDATVTDKLATDAGIEKFIYWGPKDSITRPWCGKCLAKNVPRTKAEIDALPKSPSNTSGASNFIGRGGWNCRHVWTPAVTEISAKEIADVEAKTKTHGKAATAAPKPTAPPPPPAPLASQKWKAGDPSPVGPGFGPVKSEFWKDHVDIAIAGEPKAPPGVKLSTGIVMIEDDGKVWIYEPKNHFGGYSATFPKGKVESGLTSQQNALKEAWEETGLQASITGHLGDFEATTGTTRLYVGKKISGDPTKFADETESVSLLTLDELEPLLIAQGQKYPLAALDALKERAGIKKKVAPPIPAPVAPVPPPPPAKLPKPVKPGEPPAGFPATIDDVVIVDRALGGSTGAQLVKDGNGKFYVRKTGESRDHIIEEAAADAAYQAAGANVPTFHLYEKGGKLYKLAEYIEGRQLKDLRPAEFRAAANRLGEHFGTDAVFGNHDVIGAQFDNILVDTSGEVWRIGNGGSFRRKATGGMKAGGLADDIPELWSMRDRKRNPKATEVFETVGFDRVTTNLEQLEARRADIRKAIEALPYMERESKAELLAKLDARLDAAKNVARGARALLSDSFTPHYADRFSFFGHELRREVAPSFPSKMTQQKREPISRYDFPEVELYDEKGKQWDDLRGSASAVHKFEAILARNGLKQEILADYASDQSGDSWLGRCVAAKYAIATSRSTPMSSYYWKTGTATAKVEFAHQAKRAGSERAYRDTLAAQHALTYEFLQTTPIPESNSKKRTINLMRTENPEVVSLYGLEPGKTNIYPRGALESTSIYRRVDVYGSELQKMSEVPWTRVFSMYLFDRRPGEGGGGFGGDSENEIVALLEGIPAFYDASPLGPEIEF